MNGHGVWNQGLRDQEDDQETGHKEEIIERESEGLRNEGFHFFLDNGMDFCYLCSLYTPIVPSAVEQRVRFLNFAVKGER